MAKSTQRLESVDALSDGVGWRAPINSTQTQTGNSDPASCRISRDPGAGRWLAPQCDVCDRIKTVHCGASQRPAPGSREIRQLAGSELPVWVCVELIGALQPTPSLSASTDSSLCVDFAIPHAVSRCYFWRSNL